MITGLSGLTTDLFFHVAIFLSGALYSYLMSVSCPCVLYVVADCKILSYSVSQSSSENAHFRSLWTLSALMLT